ncbi:type IV secretory system conjugative DNA transfer family protein [Candidatus Pantoea soli]|uniref:MFS transporter n=1 Tax=Candidatus Pantoea soli TaxID=3098669 RepID=A0A518XJW3_9GAMM|nr:type IV secretion system DNA-binding domain-containing protein [Pantoea soli]QDY44479.1 MFS transporter [Pantoea soli]
MNKILAKLNAASLAFSDALIWTQSYCVIMAILAGLMLPFIFNLPREKRREAPFWRKTIACLAMCFFVFGTLSPLTFFLMGFLLPRLQNGEVTNLLLWGMLIFCTGSGLAVHYILLRLISPEIESFKHRVIKKSKLERDVRTDVRKVKDLLPKTIKYDPADYIDLAKGIFIGLNESEQPQYIPVEDWQKQHADIIGTTGAGKGVITGILLYQSIMAGEGVFVLDPKDDEWAPHLYKEACRVAGKPFYLIDLRSKKYQLDLLKGVNSETLEELLNAGFSLAEKGEGADFYRLNDRRASRHVSELYEDGMTLRDLFNTEYVRSLEEEVKNFHAKLEEISLINSVNARGGMELKEVFDNGGCVYVIGSMRNPKIISAQRMILVRLLQIAESRDRINTKPRPIAIFLDELKYHLSRPALEGLGAARDKGVHIIMAHQSLGDLEDCPADLKSKAVVGAVVENTKFKLVYRLMDPATANWVAEMSGSILVDDESRRIKTDTVLVEKVDGERTVKQAERYFVDTNMLLNLPDFVSFIFTTKNLPRASMISPIKVSKRALVVYESKQPQSEVKPIIDFTDNAKLQTVSAVSVSTSDDEFAAFRMPDDEQQHLIIENESEKENKDEMEKEVDEFAAFKIQDDDEDFFKVDS